MIAFFWNLSFGEIAVIVVLSVLIFGKRLPEVAGDAFRTVAKLRRYLEDLRRESGIDREIYDVQRTFRDAAREVKAEPVARKKPAWEQDRRELEPASPNAEAPEDADPDRARAEEPRSSGGVATDAPGRAPDAESPR